MFAPVEPLLYKPLFSILQLAHDLGIDVSFTTNGYLLTRENVEKIVSARPFNVGVSLESLDPAINETIRTYRNGTKLTTEGIDRLIAESERQEANVHINVKTVLTQVNFHSYPDLVRRYGKVKNVFLTPGPYEVWNDVPQENIDKLWIKDLEGFRSIVDEVVDLKKEGYAINADEQNLRNFVKKYEKPPSIKRFSTKSTGTENNGRNNKCAIGSTTIFITHHGTVCLCPAMGPIGNIREDLTLKQIWFGENARKVRQKIKKCTTVCDKSCLRRSSLWDKVLTYLRT